MTADMSLPRPRAPADDDPVVLRLHGDHDIANVRELAALLAETLALDDRDLVVDLAEVGFVDASTIRVLLQTRDELRLRSRSLTVRASGTTARMLVLLGLDGLLERAS
jgi:anti-anti-sigma factor